MKKNNALYRHLYMRGLIVPTLFLGTTFFSFCSKKDFQPETELASEEAVDISAAVTGNPNLIFEETFEGSAYFPSSGTATNKVADIENCNEGEIAHNTSYDWTLNTAKTPLFQGSKVIRFEVRKGQPKVGTGKRTRSEVTMIKGEDSRFTTDIWYSFAVLFPSTGFEYDDTRDVINQWFEDGGDETTLKCDKNTAYLELAAQGTSSIQKRFDLFSSLTADAYSSAFSQIPKNKWHEFVFHFIHSMSSSGLIEIWRDGVKIHNIVGQNMRKKNPKWKLGLYKFAFDDGTSLASSRVIYFDNIRVGKKGSTFADMTSNQPPPSNNVKPTANAGTDILISSPDSKVKLKGAAADADGSIIAKKWTKVSGPDGPAFSDANILNPMISNLKTGTYVFRLTATDDNNATAYDDVTVTVAALPTSSIIGSLSLIDAAQDIGLEVIKDNATYSLSKLGAESLNVRANIGLGITSVKFVLSGKESKTFTDKVIPFALMGDDGKGNYWYGSWDLPTEGAYTLTATPYIATKAGTPVTVHFTFVK